MNSSNVLEMIHRIVREYGIRGFLFHDDNFFLDLAWAHSVLEGIVQSDLDLSLGKLFIRADTLYKMDNDFLRLLVRAGVKRLVMGVESGSQRINNLLKKHLTLEQVTEANRKLISYPIKPAYMFMMGIPTETPEEVAQSIHFADQLIKENPKATRRSIFICPILELNFLRLPFSMASGSLKRFRSGRNLITIKSLRSLPGFCPRQKDL